MKQTAVEWLLEQLERMGITNEIIGHLEDQAKEMEKEQLINFGQEIVDDIAYDSQDKEWVANKYKETFKSE